MSRKSLYDIFEQNATIYPENIAVKEENAAISYARMQLAVNNVALALSGAGLKQGDITAVLMPPGINWVASMLAFFKTDIVYLPLSNAYPDKRIQHIYARTKFKCLMVAESWLPRAQSLVNTLQYPVVLLVWRENGDLQELEPAIADTVPAAADGYNDGSYIIYTSGSTGAGKPILGTQKGLAHFINWQIREFSLNEYCRVSQLSSMVFDASFRDVFLPLSAGGTLYVPDETTRSNPALLVQWFARHRISLIHCVPAVWKLIIKQLENMQADTTLLSGLEYVFLAGEPLHAGDVMKWRAAAGNRAEIINLYGTSEVTMAKTFHRITTLPADPAQVLPVGQPIDNTVVAVINHNRLCRTGEVGEIYIKTPYWTKGYYNDEALTRTVFVQNPLVSGREDIVYRTGDLGRYLADQTIEVIGRVDDQVKINGIRVELGEIEQAVLRMPGIHETVVKTRLDEDRRLEMICYYTNQDITDESIRAFLKTELPEHLIPAYFVCLEEFPLTLNGKVDKKALPEPEEINSYAVAYEPPQGSTELLVESIWKEVLHKKQVGRNESFFMTGGNSLKALQVISRIYKEFKVQIKVVEIFNHQTIAELSKLIDRGRKSGIEEIPVCPEQEHYELSHAQKRIWTLYQLDPASNTYNVPQAFWLEGPIDMDALRRSVTFVINRHEMLRTNFILVDGQPRQKVRSAEILDIPLTLTDLSNEENAEKELDRLVQEAAAMPFDLQNGWLLYIALYRLSDKKHVFLLNMHHIITDEWSGEILFNELVQAYHALKQEKEITLPALRIQYKDFAAWHNRKLQLPAQQEHRNYWVSQLNGNIQEVPLPWDFPRRDVNTASGSMAAIALDKTVSAQLMELAAQNNIGPFSLLLAAIDILTYQLTGHQQVIIGTPWTCRSQAELEVQIGFYVNTLPICTKVDPKDTFIQLLQKVKDLVVQAGKHQDYPFDKLLEDLNLRRKPNRSPVFDIGFTWHDQIYTKQQDIDLAITFYRLDFTGIKSDLWFHGSTGDGIMHLLLEYNADLFRQSTAHMLLADLKNILLNIIQNPGASVHQIISNVEQMSAPVDRTAGIEFGF